MRVTAARPDPSVDARPSPGPTVVEMGHPHWAVVLASGQGTRLRPLVERLFRDARPKQYAPLLGNRSMLRQTL